MEADSHGQGLKEENESLKRENNKLVYRIHLFTQRLENLLEELRFETGFDVTRVPLISSGKLSSLDVTWIAFTQAEVRWRQIKSLSGKFFCRFFFTKHGCVGRVIV